MPINSRSTTRARTVIASPPPVEELLEIYFNDVDIVLTEGFKKSGLPKIEVHRSSCGHELLSRGEKVDPTLLAVASDGDLHLDVPVLDLNDACGVADFVERHFLPGRRCGRNAGGYTG